MKTVIFILLLSPVFALAQIAMSADPVGGTPLTGALNLEIKGNPYLFEDWHKGDIVLKNGETWKDWDIKIDIYSKMVIYKDLKGQLKKVVKPISSINFGSEGIPSVVFLGNSIYQVIAPGTVSLLKRVQKTVAENKDYTSSSTTKSFATSSDYFVLSKNSELTKTSISKSSLLKTLPEFKQIIADFSKDNSLKNETDAKLLFTEINKL
jgi:hypothetical protein